MTSLFRGMKKQLQLANGPEQGALGVRRHGYRPGNLPYTEKPRELSWRNLSILVPGFLRRVRQVWNLIGGGNFKKPGQLFFHQWRVGLRNPASPDHLPNWIVGLHIAEYSYAWSRLSDVSHVIGKLQSCKKIAVRVEGISQRSGHVRTNLALPAQDQIDALFRDAENKSEVTLQPPPLLHLLLDVESRMLHPRRLRGSHERPPISGSPRRQLRLSYLASQLCRS